jgi:hypothetical protein
MEKNTIWSTLFVAIASKKLVGTTSRTWSPKLFGAASFGVACAASAACSAAVKAGLTPGFTRFTAVSPTTSADRGHDLEVEDRAERQSPDLLQIVSVPRDPHHQRREEDRTDDHLDPADEQVREDLEVARRPPAVLGPCRVGEEEPDQHTDDHADEDEVGEREDGACSDSCRRQGGEGAEDSGRADAEPVHTHHRSRRFLGVLSHVPKRAVHRAARGLHVADVDLRARHRALQPMLEPLPKRRPLGEHPTRQRHRGGGPLVTEQLARQRAHVQDELLDRED